MLKNTGCSVRKNITLICTFFLFHPVYFKIILEYTPQGPTYDRTKSFSPTLFIPRRKTEANVVQPGILNMFILKKIHMYVLLYYKHSL